MRQPQEYLADIDAFLTRHHTGDLVDVWCEWLHRGVSAGMECPNWDTHPLGASYYRCREVSIRREGYTLTSVECM